MSALENPDWRTALRIPMSGEPPTKLNEKQFKKTLTTFNLLFTTSKCGHFTDRRQTICCRDSMQDTAAVIR